MFKELDILLPSDEAAVVASIQDIPKIIIFVDKIDDGIQVAKHLQSLFPRHMSHRKKDIICPFYSNLLASTRKDYIDDFKNRNSCILVCMEAARMGVNI